DGSCSWSHKKPWEERAGRFAVHGCTPRRPWGSVRDTVARWHAVPRMEDVSCLHIKNLCHGRQPATYPLVWHAGRHTTSFSPTQVPSLMQPLLRDIAGGTHTTQDTKLEDFSVLARLRAEEEE